MSATSEVLSDISKLRFLGRRVRVVDRPQANPPGVVGQAMSGRSAPATGPRIANRCCRGGGRGSTQPGWPSAESGRTETSELGVKLGFGHAGRHLTSRASATRLCLLRARAPGPS